MSLPLYQVHYPKIGKITIKIENTIMKYNHNDIVIEQAFFAKYPHIFKPRPDLDGSNNIINTPLEKRVETEREFIPVMAKEEAPKEKMVPIELVEEKIEEMPIPTPVPETILETEGVEEIESLTIEKAGKGWYRVINEDGLQLFPSNTTKKCRYKAGEKFISERKQK